jgi:hypothetical protein
MDLVHCIYTSAAKTELNAVQLKTLLDSCRRNNSAIAVTGILLYGQGSFFQVLEGDRLVVDTLFTKIVADTRHTRANKLIEEPIPERAFGTWSMGYPAMTAKELAQIAGLNDFFSRGSSYTDIGEGRAKTLLAAFKQGKWRTSLS